ncbi:hypothetical protein [Dysgonomonas sp. 511]|uniref:phage baseplate protein n=1 Tax=Dysgonomonas sp. 511 TaxID=2302930 RepID=UPI0013D6A319|nr:hypothetical protein [Dysgonomonas sp. 511]NDV79917.1 hypothetical protein [Dysgonomonas sp. 511]
MNNVNFLSSDQFPWSSDTFSFLQDMIKMSSRMADLGGDTYILSGCNEDGLNISSGWLVIDGEILPFEGGQKQTTIYIEETRRDVNASGYLFPQLYWTRKAAFGIGDLQYNWDSFKRVDTNLQLRAAIDALATKVNGLGGIPAGLISMWSGSIDAIPGGWALCDGLQGRPDLRGRFIVGYDRDDDDYKPIGKTGGAKQVTLSAEQIPSHSHKFTGMQYQTNTWKGGGAPDQGYVTYYQDRETQTAGGGKAHENRPPYFVLAYIIKL